MSNSNVDCAATLPTSPPRSASEILATPVKFMKGVGPPREEMMHRLGLHNAADVLFNFPRDHQDLTDLRPVAELEDDKLQTVRGMVEEIDIRGSGVGRSVVGVLLRDGQSYLRAVWFNMAYMARHFRRGQEVMFSGKVRLKGGRWEMSHPRVQTIDPDDAAPRGGELLPIYSLTDGLKQSAMQAIARSAVDAYVDLVEDRLTDEFRAQHNLAPIREALRAIHFPESQEQLQRARRRFIYQEMLALQLGLALRRNLQETRMQAPSLPATAQIDARITRLFPFPLTGDQRRTVGEIAADMARSTPMNRLLQGDVGCGKTIVAVYAMLVAVAHGCQAALMAPTEVLARQHLRTLTTLLKESRVRIGLLSGGLTGKERQETLRKLAAGEIDLVVGTQAIVYGEAQFKKLGLVVIDEQHKFGVRQRATLKQAGADPHYLVMTATPIPRTVAMTLYGDLDVSTIAESPPGRQPVKTYQAEGALRERWWEFLRKELRAGRQAYVIVPLVEESEHVDTANLEATFEELANGELEAFRLGLVHGRMTAEEKDAALSEFSAGRTQVLVATSVVEVGIDVPNATLMTILGADRFGLAQLHQMRGRVSRGKFPGYCCLFADDPSDEAKKRLEALEKHADGFMLAEIDFDLRGPGDLLGTRQHGLPPFHLADLKRDTAIVAEAREDAKRLVAEDPGLAKPQHAKLRKLVLAKYGQALDLGDVG